MNGIKDPREKRHVFNAKWHPGIFSFQEKRRLLKRFLRIVFFPVTLSALLFKRICRSLILPSSNYRKKEVRTTADIFLDRWSLRAETSLQRFFSIDLLTLHTPDGIALSGVYYNAKKRIANTPVVILFQSNSSLMQHGEYDWLLEECAKKELAIDFVSFDYRGCGESPGKAKRINDLVLDGDAAYQYVKEKRQLADERIFFYGHSLGGCISTLVQSLYPEKAIKAVNERSFSSVDKLLVKRYRRAGRLLSFLAKRLSWNASPADIWPNLRGKNLIIFQKDDEIIPFSASLFYALKSRSTKNLHYIELIAEDHTKKHPFHHSMPLSNYLDKRTKQCAEQSVFNFLLNEN